MDIKLITKIDYIEYNRCPKSFWLKKQNQEKEFDLFRLQKIKEGDEVEKLAKEMFDGIQIDYSDLDLAFKKTQELIAQKKTIFNPVFQFEDLLVIGDILFYDGFNYKLYEVKSTTSFEIFNYVKKNSLTAEIQRHMFDISFQKYVIDNFIECSYNFIMINGFYMREDELVLDKLFERISVDNKINSFLLDISDKLYEMRKLSQNENEPKVIIGSHCKNPIVCDFKKHCWKNVGEDSIHNIPRISDKKREECTSKNLLTISQKLIQQVEFTDIQQNLIQKTFKDKPSKNFARLNMFLNRLKYPINFLDFETFQTAIPPFKKTKPYDQIPFQFSLHTLERNNTIKENSFLNTENIDPRLDFTKKLIELTNNTGSIVVYNQSFESGVIEYLAEIFPQYKNELMQIKSRLFDLMIPFKDGYYYHPKMYFSYSLKAVLPALVPHLSYDGEVKDGLEAMITYFIMIKEIDVQKKEEMRQSLIKYCGLDTFGLIEILKVLKQN